MFLILFQCRLLETIGVSRSLGDHNVTTTFTRDYKLKPFLIPNPEVCYTLHSLLLLLFF